MGAGSCRVVPAADRVVAGSAAERLNEHEVEPQIARRAELRDADGHALMPVGGLGAIGSEQTVPPGQVEAEIAVGLPRNDRMVHPVHLGRDHEPAQHAVDARRHPHVAVVEHRGRIQQNLEDQHGDGRRAESRHDRQFDGHGQQDFDRVKAGAGGDVEIEIGVVHPVQPPERGHRVEHDVLEIDREVEEDDRQRHGEAIGDRGNIEQTPAPLSRQKRHTYGRRWRQDAQENRIKGDNAQIARPSDPPGDRTAPTGHQNLPQRHDRENPKKEAESDRRFVCQSRFSHHSNLEAAARGSNQARQGSPECLTLTALAVVHEPPWRRGSNYL